MVPEVRGLDRALGNDRTFGDMYSLGMVMYMYLNQGIYPSNSERIDRMPPDKAPFPEPRYGSRRLKKLVLRATSYDPKDRFESPQAMLRELQNCVEYKQFIGQTDENSRDTVLFQEDEHEEVRRLQDENEQLRQIIVHAKSRPSPVAESGYSKSAYHLSEKDIYSSTSKTMSKQNIILLSAVGVTVLGLLLSIGLWLGSRSNAKGEASSASVVDTQKLVINEQPESVTTRPNKLVRFKVVASGTGLKYQWYYRKKGISSWSKWRIYYTAEIEPPANETWDGLQVRCKVTDCEGNSVYSEVASVTLIPYETGDFMITQQPKSFKVKKSEVGKKSLQFSVKANGKDMKYQWYFCKSGETAWTLWDERTSSSFKAVPNNSWDGILIYCKITNYDSEELYSNLSSVSFTDD